MADPFAELGFQKDEFGELGFAPGNGPISIGNPPDLRSRHQANEAAGQKAYQSAQRGTELASGAVRGIGGMFGMIPGAGPFLAGGADIAAQMIEKAGGTRQTYNPARTAVEAGLSAIPGIPLGSLAKPAATAMGTMGKGAATMGVRALEGAVRGAAAVAATSLSEGEAPTGEQLKSAAQWGAGLSPLASISSLNSLRKVTGRAKASYNAASHIARAVRLPPDAERGVEKLQDGAGLVLTHAASTRGPLQTINDLSEATTEARKIFGQAHIDPFKENFGAQPINATPAFKKAAAEIKEIHKESDPALTGKLKHEEDILSKARPASELLEYYHTLENEIHSFTKAGPAARTQKYGEVEWRFKLKLKNALQDMLSNYFDSARAFQEGTTVDDLRKAGNGFRSINRQYGSLRFLDDLAKGAATQHDNMKLSKAGELITPAVAAEKVLSPIFLSKRRLAGQALEMVISGRNDPDNLVKKAQRVYRRYGTPSKMPDVMGPTTQAAPPWPAGPGPTSPGPIHVNNPPTPPSAGPEPNLPPDVRYRGVYEMGGVAPDQQSYYIDHPEHGQIDFGHPVGGDFEAAYRATKDRWKLP